MSMNANTDAQGLPLNLAGGRGTRIPDLRLLLAVHAARQAMGQTVRTVRDRDLPVVAEDEPARLTLILGKAPLGSSAFRRVAGPFHATVAAYLAMDRDGEDEIHLGS